MAQPSSSNQALIDAAIDLFGQHGYSAVSTRALSQQAGTNVAAIKYHFGGKDELYRSAVQHVVDILAPRLDMVLTGFTHGRDLAGGDRNRQARLIVNLVAGLLSMFLGSEEMKRFIPFVTREFFVPSQHFDLFYEALPRRLHTLFTEIVAMAHGLDPASEEAVIRAHALIGQIMVFNIGRAILFRRLDWDDYNEERIRIITGEVETMILQALDLEAPDEVD